MDRELAKTLPVDLLPQKVRGEIGLSLDPPSVLGDKDYRTFGEKLEFTPREVTKLKANSAGSSVTEAILDAAQKRHVTVWQVHKALQEMEVTGCDVIEKYWSDIYRNYVLTVQRQDFPDSGIQQLDSRADNCHCQNCVMFHCNGSQSAPSSGTPPGENESMLNGCQFNNNNISCFSYAKQKPNKYESPAFPKRNITGEGGIETEDNLSCDINWIPPNLSSSELSFDDDEENVPQSPTCNCASCVKEGNIDQCSTSHGVWETRERGDLNVDYGRQSSLVCCQCAEQVNVMKRPPQYLLQGQQKPYQDSGRNYHRNTSPASLAQFDYPKQIDSRRVRSCIECECKMDNCQDRPQAATPRTVDGPVPIGTCVPSMHPEAESPLSEHRGQLEAPQVIPPSEMQVSELDKTFVNESTSRRKNLESKITKMLKNLVVRKPKPTPERITTETIPHSDDKYVFLTFGDLNMTHVLLGEVKKLCEKLKKSGIKVIADFPDSTISIDQLNCNQSVWMSQRNNMTEWYQRTIEKATCIILAISKGYNEYVQNFKENENQTDVSMHRQYARHIYTILLNEFNENFSKNKRFYPVYLRKVSATKDDAPKWLRSTLVYSFPVENGVDILIEHLVQDLNIPGK